MNLFRRAMARTAALALKGAGLTLDNPQGWDIMGTGRTWANIPVSASTQLQITTAWSAIRKAPPASNAR